MAIRIESRIKPNVTRMVRIPRLHPNNDPNVDLNRAEYAENATELPEFATKSLDLAKFGPKLKPNEKT